jgi:hypothetical protein
MPIDAQGMKRVAAVGRQPTCTAGTSEIMTGGSRGIAMAGADLNLADLPVWQGHERLKGCATLE